LRQRERRDARIRGLDADDFGDDDRVIAGRGDLDDPRFEPRREAGDQRRPGDRRRLERDAGDPPGAALGRLDERRRDGLSYGSRRSPGTEAVRATKVVVDRGAELAHLT